MAEVPPNAENWQVDPPPKKRTSMLWVLAIVAVGGMCLIVLVFAALLMPLFFKAKENAQVQGCSNHLRKLGAAAIMYSSDNDDRLPGANWMSDLRQYEDDHLSYSCPVQRRMDPETFGYAFYKPLAGIAMAAVEFQNTTPMFFDSTEKGKSVLADINTLPNPARHDNGRSNVICFVNGSTRTVRVGQEGSITKVAR